MEKFHSYPEEVHRSFCYSYVQPLVLCGESFQSLFLFPGKHPHQ